MASKTLILENFRGKSTAEYHFAPGVNKLVGKNGAGKSSVKEALVFALTGTDSLGNRNPQHLISHDKPGMKVTLVSDKSEITRTLTRKGNGTLRLKKGDNNFSLTQTELEQQLGSTDLFLSSFLPGYFLDLPTERQHRVIAEITPPVNRLAMFAQIAGFEMNAEEQLHYGLNRRCDLVASDVASDRRDLEKMAAKLLGEILALESVQPVPKPTPTSAGTVCGRLELLKEQWMRYRLAISLYNTTKTRVVRIRAENCSREERRQEIRAQLATIKPAETHLHLAPEVLEQAFCVKRDQRKQVPPTPPLLALQDAPICAACGQTVGMKHRERVKQQNDAALKVHQDKVAEIIKHNDEIEAQLALLKQEWDKAHEQATALHRENQKLAAVRHALEIELAGLVDAELPELPAEPKAPEDVYDEAAHTRAKTELEAHQAEVARHHYAQEQLKVVQSRLAPIKQEYASYQEHMIPHLQAVEAAIKAIPQKELEQQHALFKFAGVEVTFGGKVEATVNQVPYHFLSCGEKIKVGIMFALCINNNMPKSTRMLFLDDADLLDETPNLELQVFVAHVDTHCATLTIHHGEQHG